MAYRALSPGSDRESEAETRLELLTYSLRMKLDLALR